MPICHPMSITRGLSLYGVKESAPPKGTPHVVVGSARVEGSCPWTQTVWGFEGQIGCSDNGQWCLGKERSGWHRARWCSPRAKRHWL